MNRYTMTDCCVCTPCSASLAKGIIYYCTMIQRFASRVYCSRRFVVSRTTCYIAYRRVKYPCQVLGNRVDSTTIEQGVDVNCRLIERVIRRLFELLETKRRIACLMTHHHQQARVMIICFCSRPSRLETHQPLPREMR